MLADPDRRPAHPALPFPERGRPASRRHLPARARRPPSRRPDLPARAGQARSASPTRGRYTRRGLRARGNDLVVSRGLGTTFVPFRFFARPEAALLVLRPRLRIGYSRRLQSGREPPPSTAHRATRRRCASGLRRLRVLAVADGSGDRQGALDRADRGGVGRVGNALRRDGDRLLGSIQYGPAPFFPRAYELPAGPPSDDAVLVTCAYLVDRRAPGSCRASSWP